MSSEPDAKRSRHVVRDVGGLLLLVVVLGLVMSWLSGRFVEKVKPQPPAPLPAPPTLKTAPVVRRNYPLLIEQVGTLQTQSEARISSRLLAQVVEVKVREGDTVTGPDTEGKGATVLARLDDRDIQAQIRQAQSRAAGVVSSIEAAKANLEAARANLEAAKASRDEAAKDFVRTEDLYRSKTASGEELDRTRARRDVTEAQLRARAQEIHAAEQEIQRLQAQGEEVEGSITEARVMLSHTVIQAPFAGRITKKMIDVGDMVNPGAALFLVETPARPELDAVVSESLLSNLQRCQTLDVTVDALKLSLTGQVSDVIPRADPITRTVLVKVSLPPHPALVSGLFGRLIIPLGHYDALVVPETGVRQAGQLDLVDVVSASGHPERRFVALGRRHPGVVEVLSGVREGEQVVVP